MGLCYLWLAALEHNTFQAATHKKRNLKRKESLGLWCYMTLEKIHVYREALPKRSYYILSAGSQNKSFYIKTQTKQVTGKKWN